MLSGLPERGVTTAVFTDLLGVTGFIAALRVTVRAGVALAIWLTFPPGAYLSITTWQAAESCALFCTMQATVRLRSGMVAEQTRKASFMQACCSSLLCAKAPVETVATVSATASVIWFMEDPLLAGDVSLARAAQHARSRSPSQG